MQYYIIIEQLKRDRSSSTHIFGPGVIVILSRPILVLTVLPLLVEMLTRSAMKIEKQHNMGF